MRGFKSQEASDFWEPRAQRNPTLWTRLSRSLLPRATARSLPTYPLSGHLLKVREPASEVRAEPRRAAAPAGKAAGFACSRYPCARAELARDRAPRTRERQPPGPADEPRRRRPTSKRLPIFRVPSRRTCCARRRCSMRRDDRIRLDHMVDAAEQVATFVRPYPVRPRHPPDVALRRRAWGRHPWQGSEPPLRRDQVARRGQAFGVAEE